MKFECDIHCVVGGMGSGEGGGKTLSPGEEVNGDKHHQIFYK